MPLEVAGDLRRMVCVLLGARGSEVVGDEKEMSWRAVA